MRRHLIATHDLSDSGPRATVAGYPRGIRRPRPNKDREVNATEGRHLRAAFTLIELATVMSVLAVLAVVVGGPLLTFIATQRARVAATRIAADITYAQRLAMNSRRRTWVLFDVPNNRYNLYAENLANPGKANRLPLAAALSGDTAAVQLGSGDYSGAAISSVSINSTSELEFNNLGAPADANGTTLPADATITLASGVVITVRRVSGFVEQSG